MIIQIKNGAPTAQLAAKQQLLDTTIKATRGEIYDVSGITLASTQRGVDHLGRPQLQQHPLYQQDQR